MKKTHKKTNDLVEMLNKQCEGCPHDCRECGYKIIMSAILDLILFRLRFLLFLCSVLIGAFFTYLVTHL